MFLDVLDATKLAATVGAGRQLREVVSSATSHAIFAKIVTHSTLATGIERLTIINEIYGGMAFWAKLDLAVNHLKELRVLHLGLGDALCNASVSLVCRLPKLTDLALSDGRSSRMNEDEMPSVSVLTRLHDAGLTIPLKRLQLDSANLYGPAFRANLLLPAFVALEDLVLKNWNASTTTAADLEATFGTMRSLRKLALFHVFGVNLVLPHLRHAVALSSLETGSAYGFASDPRESMLAHPGPLGQALQGNKLLLITIESPQSNGPSFDKIRVYGYGMMRLENLGPRLAIVQSLDY
jgi:hypothetical protein